MDKYLLITLFLFANLFSQEIFLGDLNEDSTVNVIDIIFTINIILGSEPTNQQFQNGDVNEDLELNIQDVIIIVQIIMEVLCPEGQIQCSHSTLNCCANSDIEFGTLTFGDYASDIFDSWIFTQNNIVAVGHIGVEDQGEHSGAKWDGENWELIQLMYNGSPRSPRGIWAFSEIDIYLTTGSIYHWDGNSEYLITREWTIDHENYPNESGREIWASSAESIYFVGSGGGIIHYNGSEFNRMESGTDIELKDVWGIIDSDTGEETVWACGWNDMAESVFLVYNGESWEPVYDVQSLYWEYFYDQLSGGVSSVWATDDFLYVLTTTGLYKCPHDYQGEANLILESTWFENYWYQVRGTGDNDIFVVGYNQEIFHFNGEFWELLTYNSGDLLVNIQVSEETIIVGGHRFEGGPNLRALLLHGARDE